MNRKTFIGACLAGIAGIFIPKTTHAKFPKLKPGKLMRVPQIRLWKLGNLDKGIIPSKETIDRLAELLKQTNGETVDIIWGPEIEVQCVEVTPEAIDLIGQVVSETDKEIVIKVQKHNG